MPWLASWREGLPEWNRTPGGINLPVLLWLHNLVEAWDLEGFGQARYGLLGNAGHWFPGYPLAGGGAGERFALFVLDPPAFAKSRRKLPGAERAEFRAGGNFDGDLEAIGEHLHPDFAARGPAGQADRLEPAAIAKPVIVGPHTFNFSDITNDLIACGGAFRVQDAESLAGDQICDGHLNGYAVSGTDPFSFFPDFQFHLAPHLARERYVLAPDLSGHGDSDWRERSPRELWARELGALVRHDRRARRAFWKKDNDERTKQGQPPAGGRQHKRHHGQRRGG